MRGGMSTKLEQYNINSEQDFLHSWIRISFKGPLIFETCSFGDLFHRLKRYNIDAIQDTLLFSFTNGFKKGFPCLETTDYLCRKLSLEIFSDKVS